MQQSWCNETQKLMDEVAALEAENERLKCQLENAAAEAESEETNGDEGVAYPCVSELVAGRSKHTTRRPPSLLIQPAEVDSLLAHTEERLLLTQQDSEHLRFAILANEFIQHFGLNYMAYVGHRVLGKAFIT